MIKRRFYKLEHGEKDDLLDSGSSSDSDAEPQTSDNDSEIELEEEDDEQKKPELKSDDPSTPQSSSGYESGDSFWDEIEGKLAGKLESEDEVDTKSKRQNRPLNDQFSNNKESSDKENTQAELDALLTCDDDKWYILKLKSVYKCRICPTVICLNEESLISHLKSKRHSRSKKLLADGRLESMLNNFGDPESDGLTHAERHANIVTAMPVYPFSSGSTPFRVGGSQLGVGNPYHSAILSKPQHSICSYLCLFCYLDQDDEKEKKKSRAKGRQRQRLRLKRKREKNSSDKAKNNNSNMKKSEFGKENPAKKKRKNVKGKA